jgi:hypothetical protein
MAAPLVAMSPVENDQTGFRRLTFSRVIWAAAE